MKNWKRAHGLTLALVTLTVPHATGATHRVKRQGNEKVIHTHYDGVTNDLLTAGLLKRRRPSN